MSRLEKLLYCLLFSALILVGVTTTRDIPTAQATTAFTTDGTDPGKATGVATSTLPFQNVTNNATTSYSRIWIGNASSTQTEYVGSSDKNYMYLQFAPTTVGATLNWSVEYSLDNVDFFGEDIASTTILGFTVPSAFVEHSSSTPIHRWNPGKVGTSTKMIILPEGIGNYVRVSFSVVGGNGSYWADIIPKRNTN